jgi:hypothetical protein
MGQMALVIFVIFLIAMFLILIHEVFGWLVLASAILLVVSVMIIATLEAKNTP